MASRSRRPAGDDDPVLVRLAEASGECRELRRIELELEGGSRLQ
jgi:hypothetical protein